MLDTGESQSELSIVRAERDALLNHDVDVWLETVIERSVSVADFQRSLSWRITKPLRLLRGYQIRVTRDGFLSTNAQAFDLLRKRLIRR